MLRHGAVHRCLCLFVCFFFFNDTATTEIYPLPLHDALPISMVHPYLRRRQGRERADCLHPSRSEEHTSELQSPCNLVCRLLLEKKKLFGPLFLAIVGIVAIFFLFTRGVIRFWQFVVLSVAFAVIFYTPSIVFFFFNDTATTEIYPLSLHDALPFCSFSWRRISSPDPPSAPTTWPSKGRTHRSEEHTSELQSPCNLVCRLLLEK